MIEEKLKIAVEQLPVPQTSFKSIVERAAQKPKEKRRWEGISGQIMRGIISVKDE